MKQLKHVNLVDFITAIDEPGMPHSLFIVLEYVEAGPIMKLRGPGETNTVNESFRSAVPLVVGAPQFYAPLTGGVMGESLACTCCDSTVLCYSRQLL